MKTQCLQTTRWKATQGNLFPVNISLIYVNINIGRNKEISMIVLEYKVKGKSNQYKAIDEGYQFKSYQFKSFQLSTINSYADNC